MGLERINRGELIATVGGIVLGLTLLMSWYDLGNAHATLNACRGPNTACSGWNSLSVLRYLVLIAAVAPAILAYIIFRGHALSWPRGELTALTALIALTMTLFRGLLDKPGSPSGEISIDYGWWVAVGAGLLILVGALARSQESGPRRKPPGVL